jgi:hypothetical protein
MPFTPLLQKLYTFGENFVYMCVSGWTPTVISKKLDQPFANVLSLSSLVISVLRISEE